MLLHLVDIADPMTEPEEAIRIIQGELEAFSPELLNKPCWLVGTKLDVIQDDSRKVQFENICRSRGQEPIFISGVTGEGIRSLVFNIAKTLKTLG